MTVIGSPLLGVGALGVASALVGWWLRTHLVIITVCGSSVLPTYRSGDRLLARYRPAESLRQGQVVVADPPEADGGGYARTPRIDTEATEPVRQRVVKRIAAAPGEPVPAGVPGQGTRVPDGAVVLLGDNPALSIDSRHYGWVDTDRVVAVVLRPLHRPSLEVRPVSLPR